MDSLAVPIDTIHCFQLGFSLFQPTSSTKHSVKPCKHLKSANGSLLLHHSHLASLQNLEDPIEKNEDLAACRLGADGPWYNAIIELCEACPDDWSSDGALHEAVERMSRFWITNARHHLQIIISLMSGDGEVLAMLMKYRPPSPR